MADVSSNLYQWSTTAASNNPSGSTSIGTGLDDNLREMQAVVRAALAHKGADIASATTTDLGAVAGLMHDITGTTTITGFGTVSAGIWKVVKFEGALTLTHNATSLILPAARNITTADGDVGIFISEGSGNWRCLSYQRANGKPVLGGITLGTEQATTSGTSIDFTSIPSGARRITVMFVGVSTNGTDNILIQLGDAGGVEDTGYTSNATLVGGSDVQSTAGFIVTSGLTAASTCRGRVVLELEDSSDFTWVCSGTLIRDTAVQLNAGAKALSAELDRIRITTTGGSNTFDAGSVNISYEF